MLCGAPLIVQVMQSTSTDLLIFGSSNTVPYSAWSNCLNWSVSCSNLLAFALRLPSLNPRDPLLGNLFSHIWTFKVSCSSNHSNFFHTWRAYPHAVSESSALNIWRSCLWYFGANRYVIGFRLFWIWNYYFPLLCADIWLPFSLVDFVCSNFTRLADFSSNIGQNVIRSLNTLFCCGGGGALGGTTASVPPPDWWDLTFETLFQMVQGVRGCGIPWQS